MWSGLTLHMWSHIHHLVMVSQGYLFRGSQMADVSSEGQGLPSVFRQAEFAARAP